MTCLRIEVQQVLETHAGTRIVKDANLLGIPLRHVKITKGYILEAEHTHSVLSKVVEEVVFDLFCDPLIETYTTVAEPWSLWNQTEPNFVLEVSFRAGVTDNVGRSVEEALSFLGHEGIAVSTSTLYALFGNLTEMQALEIGQQILGNTLIEDIRVWSAGTADRRFVDISRPKVQLESQNVNLLTTIDMRQSIEDLLLESQERCWALNREELSHIQDHFTEQNPDRARRVALGLSIDPTDVEMEILAQTWSEHCKHKIFNAQITYTENLVAIEHSLGDQTINSLFRTYIRSATETIETNRNIDWLRSVFHDNAGVVRFDQQLDVAIKVETHNSPSALDPYGGAITGILGVNRDVLGVGLGAKPISNMDVFCTADPSWPLLGMEEQMPVGLFYPGRLLEGIHKGVEEGGNKSGIPTINGAMFVDRDYAGKPLVFVGTVGVMPHRLPNGHSTVDKTVEIGDRIVMVGGAIGADGIHGATFSSLELNENSPVTAVQIGDPLTQKRMLDFILEARDLGLYTCITDNGAGGLSSSVGEMACFSGGARLDLQRAPTKYAGLVPWELMVSESQERMTLAVPPDKLDRLLQLAKQRGVVATDLGYFSDSGYLDVYYGIVCVASLSLNFLHDSLPQMKLVACWDGPRKRETWLDEDYRYPNTNVSWLTKIHRVLSSPNVRSKESWVRQYDHEVQGATHIKPFGGKTQTGPNDAGVIWLYPHGGERQNAVAIGCGLAPRMSLYDPYLMAQYAVDEAIRNVVAVGGDIDNLCLLDNFCWPDPVQSSKTPDGEYKLGQLVRCCAGLHEICLQYGTPLVSGKDSMKNDFRGVNGGGEPMVISILPTLLVTAMAKSSVQATQTSDFKLAGDLIYLIGKDALGLSGSEYAEHFVIDASQSAVPPVDMEMNHRLYKKMFEGHQRQLFASVHDISDGGLVCALIESCFGNGLGCRVEIEPTDQALFSEGTGRFVVSISPNNHQDFLRLFAELPHQYLGAVTEETTLTLEWDERVYCSASVESFFVVWREDD